MNLAIAFAMTEAKVLLIDCDLRRPVIAQSFFRASSPGISNVLAGISEEDEALREVTYNGVYFHIIPSGDIPPNPSELLGSPRAENVFASLAEKYDYIFVDLPPIGVVSDALVLSKLLTGLIMVVRFGRTKRDDVKRALERINLAGADMLGFVLNDAKRTKNKRYYADKYSGYGNAPNR
jgi:capsular exopolysaccharide synthesis family protein